VVSVAFVYEEVDGVGNKNIGIPRNFVPGVEGGVQQIQLRTEDRKIGDLGSVAL
jgi:hypothetical protein